METSRIRYSILLSAGIQLAPGTFTAHPYDGRVFFTVGHSVAHGNSPHVHADVSGVFGLKTPIIAGNILLALLIGRIFVFDTSNAPANKEHLI